MAMDTAMVDMDMDTMVTTARDLLMLRPPLLPSQDMDTMAVDMDILDMVMDMDMVMDTMDTMARDLLRLSQDMATTVMVMDMVMAMVDMDMDTMVTTARDLLMLSQDMDTMVMVMDMVMDTMDMDMVMVMDTTDKYLSFLLCSLEFSTNEIGPSFGTSHFQTIQKSSINYFY